MRTSHSFWKAGSNRKIRGKIHYGELETVVGAKLVGEISTDWDGDQTVSQPAVSDRLEAFSVIEEDSDTSDEDLWEPKPQVIK